MRTRTLPVLLWWGFALAFYAAPAAAETRACSLSGLAWMAGDWRSAATPDRAQERWVTAPDAVLMGSAWEVPADGHGYAEVMTIRQNGDAIDMLLRHFDAGLAHAWEERDAPIIFAAATCGSDHVVFEGLEPHVGEQITYARAGDTLLITGDFLHHGVRDHEEWRMILAGG